MKRNLWVLVTLACSLAFSEGMSAQVQLDPNTSPDAPLRLKDQPTEAYRIELLELAWTAATSYPVNPHIKNRGRAEEQVVKGAIAIGQPQLAWGMANKVVNWRRGMCYAEIAHDLIERGEREHANYFLYHALKHAQDEQQGWRQARVRARVATARILMGQVSAGKDLIESEDTSGQGQAIGAQAAIAGDAGYDRLLADLDGLVASGQYEALIAALHGYADLYTHHYKHADRRAVLVDRARKAGEQMPGIIRFDVMMQFVRAALEHDDAEEARLMLDHVEKVHRLYRWTVDFYLPMRSAIAKHRVEAGQPASAREILDDCLAVGDKQLESLENYKRAGALRPVAEGFAKLGDTERAHRLYARVVEMGAVNPNIRPRVSDVTAACVSMAVYGIEPDAELLAEIKQIVCGLATP